MLSSLVLKHLRLIVLCSLYYKELVEYCSKVCFNELILGIVRDHLTQLETLLVKLSWEWIVYFQKSFN